MREHCTCHKELDYPFDSSFPFLRGAEKGQAAKQSADLSVDLQGQQLAKASRLTTFPLPTVFPNDFGEVSGASTPVFAVPTLIAPTAPITVALATFTAIGASAGIATAVSTAFAVVAPITVTLAAVTAVSLAFATVTVLADFAVFAPITVTLTAFLAIICGQDAQF
jgi:hypothetical protein